MASSQKKLLVIQAAALGYELVHKNGFSHWQGLEFKPLQAVFPAVTCTAQASFRTGLPSGTHGMVGNGFFHHDLMRPMFWEQACRLVEGPRIWDKYQENGHSVAMLFWQQSLGESADYLISPAPIHKHHGGMIQSCYSKPASLYPSIRKHTSRDFNLMHYWGPLASAKSSNWIAEASASVLANPDVAADLCFTYLPVLDYDLQRHGPDSPQALKALNILFQELETLLTAADKNGYDVLIFGDYAISSVTRGAVLPNLALQKSGLFHCRNIKGANYPDFYTSPAFAVVDHEIAHIHVNASDKKEEVFRVLRNLPGVGEVLDKEAQQAQNIAHERSGDFIIIAEEGYWFAYPWWEDKKQAPDYASHVDIHNKPGYDPCELFFGWPPMSISQNTGKIKGTHGRIDGDRQVAMASTFSFENEPESLLNLARSIQNRLD
ncbi:MAG: alkaline phosphatase family protein [Fibrobacteria bacterium]|nr:alkaline phosphatase family protein [Fibrobacteria bacterium]